MPVSLDRVLHCRFNQKSLTCVFALANWMLSFLRRPSWLLTSQPLNWLHKYFIKYNYDGCCMENCWIMVHMLHNGTFCDVDKNRTDVYSHQWFRAGFSSLLWIMVFFVKFPMSFRADIVKWLYMVGSRRICFWYHNAKRKDACLHLFLVQPEQENAQISSM